MAIDPLVWRRIVAVEFIRKPSGMWDVVLHTSDDFSTAKPGPIGLSRSVLNDLTASDLAQVRETLSRAERCYLDGNNEFATDALDIEDLASVYPHTLGTIHT